MDVSGWVRQDDHAVAGRSCQGRMIMPGRADHAGAGRSCRWHSRFSIPEQKDPHHDVGKAQCHIPKAELTLNMCL